MYYVIDQNDSSFGATSVADGIERAQEYATLSRKPETFRVYEYDKENPYPGTIAAWVVRDRTGSVEIVTRQNWRFPQ